MGDGCDGCAVYAGCERDGVNWLSIGAVAGRMAGMETIDGQKQAEGKVAILHGFTREEIFAVMRAVKRELGPDKDVAFAMTTKHSLQLKLQDVVDDIAQEHAYLKANPPTPKSPVKTES